MFSLSKLLFSVAKQILALLIIGICMIVFMVAFIAAIYSSVMYLI